jgi:hypothetical protein
MVHVLILLAATLFSVQVAAAAPIAFEFTTTVVSVESAFLGVQPGDSVVGRYVFESTTPSTSPIRLWDAMSRLLRHLKFNSAC